MNSFSHLDEHGQANMVDVANKKDTEREAYAEGRIYLNKQALTGIVEQSHKKGDVLSTARIAGIMAAKQTSTLVPLCHPLPIQKVSVNFEIESEAVKVLSYVKTTGKTGVEMEALTAVNIACLTLFDMCKAIDPSMTISDVKVTKKIGGKTGVWHHPQEQH